MTNRVQRINSWVKSTQVWRLYLHVFALFTKQIFKHNTIKNIRGKIHENHNLKCLLNRQTGCYFLSHSINTLTNQAFTEPIKVQWKVILLNLVFQHKSMQSDKGQCKCQLKTNLMIFFGGLKELSQGYVNFKCDHVKINILGTPCLCFCNCHL